MSDLVRLGVGLDTARYGHCAYFMSEDLQPAAKPLSFRESRQGYQQFEDVLRRLAQRHGNAVHFDIRIDAAGQYATNLEAFLRRLDLPKTVSVGQPKLNNDYKNVHFPKRKSDQVDSQACARFAIVERPEPSAETPPGFVQLRDVASALTSASRTTTRHVNQLHNHLARAFPELATLAPNIAADWVLTLLDKYPTPQRIAAARVSSLTKIPHVDQQRAIALQQAAATTVGSLGGLPAENLIRQMVAAVQQSQQAERKLETLLQQAFDALPQGGHQQLLSIPGIGKRTAAALVAKIIAIDRFPTLKSLVGYFGVFPEENSSGVDKRGKPVPQGTMFMSNKGNDLVRGLLWMAAQSAAQCNPAVRSLYRREIAAGKTPAVALGHCMRKLLRLVYAAWKTNRPFDPNHYPWEPTQSAEADDIPQSLPTQPHNVPPSGNGNVANANVANKSAAGPKGQSPVGKEVTAAANQLVTRIVPPAQAAANPTITKQAPIDFARFRQQLRMTDVLQKLGLFDKLSGSGPQRRGPGPIHQPNHADGRVFSVNLEKQVFRCLNPSCAAQGNVLDLWADVHRLPLLDAAYHLADALKLDIPLLQTTTKSTREMNT